MADIKIISTSSIQAPSSIIDQSPKKIHLAPWDLKFLKFEMNQEGLLYHNPINNVKDQIQQLKHSLSSTLHFFPPFTGRLVIVLEHEDNNTASSYLLCNNAGAAFVHAVADNTFVADILQSTYIPQILCSFFPQSGVKNFEGTSQPLLAVQVTELGDGIFIGFTFNHVVADGKSFYRFVNSWAEISRGCNKIITKLPTFERWFLDGVDPPIRFPFTKEEMMMMKQHSDENFKPQSPPVRIFHFTKEKISQLKSKANEEANTNKISSLQALLNHLWHFVTGAQKLDPHEETCYIIVIDFRGRMVPPLGENYFGNGVEGDVVTMKVGELLEGGLGKGAWEMHKMIDSHFDEKVKSYYKSWMKNPYFIKQGQTHASDSLVIAHSPKFNVYDNDFGWGKAIAARSGSANNCYGKISVLAGVEEGSIEIHACLPYEILEVMGNDPYFTDVIISHIAKL
ncbi:hypothetical protein RIF29_36475 [Crotalaria pallida]|uniref:HXXXD-type acyl-transferase family protein n=1 Tax=Crotalaria pallida TaxID=3830 RepID=A0AAN9EHN8_CROPI